MLENNQQTVKTVPFIDRLPTHKIRIADYIPALKGGRRGSMAA